MKTIDEILKMKATVLYILQKNGGILDYIKLYKLLYFAQQHHLVNYGHTIINDSFYAHDKGPVPGFIYRGVKYREFAGKGTSALDVFANGFEFINGKPKQIKALETPDMEEFSVSDLTSLDYILSKYSNYSSEELVKLSHRDSAWKKANNKRMEDPEKNKISRIDIARAGNASHDMISYIRHEITLDQELSR